MKKLIKNKYFVYIALVLTSALVFLPELVSLLKDHAIYYIKSDYVKQYIPFYREFFRLVDSGEIGWSWNLFLGSNFFASKSYYVVGDVFVWLTYFIDKILHKLPLTMFGILILKYMLSSVFFCMFLRKFKLKDSTCYLFSLFYSFAGWPLIFMEYTQFSSFYVFLPLLLLGAEIFLREEKPYIFMIGSFLMICCNFYLFWSACILLLFYWIVRYCILYSFHIKEFFGKSFKILGYLLIVCGLSSFIWLPTVKLLLNSPRISNHYAEHTSWNLVQITRIIISFFTVMPTTQMNSIYGMDSLYNFGDSYYFAQMGTFAYSLTILLIPHVLTSFENKKEKIAYSIWAGISFLLLISPKIGIGLLFTYSLRYTYIISFMMLFIAAQIFDKERLNKKGLFVSTLLMIIMFLLIRFVLMPALFGENVRSYIEYRMINVSFLFEAVLCCLLWLKDSKRQVVIYMIVAVSLLEVVHSARIMIDNQRLDNGVYFLQDEAEELLRVYEAIGDDSFYRVWTNYKGDYGSWNDLLYLGIKTNCTYDSVWQNSLRDYLYCYKQAPDYLWTFLLEEPNSFDNLCIRYAIMDKGFSFEFDIDEYADKLDIQSDLYDVYKFRRPSSLAKTFNSLIDINAPIYCADDNYYSVNEILGLMDNDLPIYLKDKEIYHLDDYIGHEDYEQQYFDPVYYDNNHVDFSFDLKQDCILYLSIPYDEGWSIMDNGAQADPFIANGGFIGLTLKEGHHELTLDYHVPGLSVSYYIMAASAAALVFVSVKKKRSDERE